MLNIDALKVGDRVGYARFSGYGMASHGFSTVAKTNAHRIVLENGREFNRRGQSKNEYDRVVLLDATDLEERVAEQQKQRDRDGRYHAFQQLVENTLRNRRNGYGNHGELTAEEKAAIIEAATNL